MNAIGANESIRLPSRFPHACGFVRLTQTAGIEFELYDHSELAEQFFGGDVATIYGIAAVNVSQLFQALPMQDKAPPKSIETVNHENSLDGENAVRIMCLIADSFETIEDLIEWLEQAGVAYSKTFDTSA